MNVEALEHRRFRPKQNGHYDLAYTPPPPVPAYFDVARRKLTRGLARRSNIFHVPVNKTPATVDFAFFFLTPKSPEISLLFYPRFFPSCRRRQL